MNINEIAKPIIENLGYEFVGTHVVPSQGQACIRIFIDKTGGVNIDDCVQVTRQLNSTLAVEGSVLDHYTLEVSSPGINRPLFEKDYFDDRFIGQEIKIECKQAIENQKKFKGILGRGAENTFTLEMDSGQIIELTVQQVKKGNVIARIER